jgi:transcriptional regulator with XRE-family HTH domain
MAAETVKRGTFILLRRPSPKGMLRLLGRTTGAPAPMASSAHRSQMTLQTPRSFNAWLRGQLKEKKMSQRQLALQSGVDHSTISRLIKGDRMPSLGTATKLARGLREIGDESDGPAYFASLNSRSVLPTTRVEYALRGDDILTEADVRELMQAYINVRQRRIRSGGNGARAANGFSR